MTGKALAPNTGMGSPPSLPTLTPTMEAAIYESGFLITPWSPPSAMPPTMIAEASIAALATRAALEDIAPKSLAGKWLLELGNLCASVSRSDAEVATKVQMILKVCDLPRFCFTPATLVEAAQTFKFFPSYAELYELLNAHVNRERARYRKLRALASVSTGDQSDRTPPPDDPTLVRDDWRTRPRSSLTAAELLERDKDTDQILRRAFPNVRFTGRDGKVA